MCSNTVSNNKKLLSTIEPQELQCLLQTTLNNVNWKQWSVSCACLDGEEDGGQSVAECS
ncbi:hypothetical protein INR49_022069 [Caranx melampygus]|nr:hypothetical protein INR49_022069 [Caranx melampygus]